MGAQFSKIRNMIVGVREVRVLMLGLDAAGKTTILYGLDLKPNQNVTTIPTVGFNVESITYKGFKFNCWDVGGQDKIRPLWRHYYSGTEALIFVVDSSDHHRIDEARQELDRILSDIEMASVRLLVLANKQDIPSSMKEQEVTERLRMTEKKVNCWRVQPSCAKDGRGLDDGLEWLANTYKKGNFNPSSSKPGSRTPTSVMSPGMNRS